MSVKLSVFLRALGLMGYTPEIKKEGKTVVSIGRGAAHRRKKIMRNDKRRL